MVTHCLLVTNKFSQPLVLNKSSVLPRKMLIGHAHSSQFMERLHLGIATLKHAVCSSNVL